MCKGSCKVKNEQYSIFFYTSAWSLLQNIQDQMCLRIQICFELRMVLEKVLLQLYPTATF